MDDSMKLYALPELQTRLKIIAGSPQRYVAATHKQLPKGLGSVEWLRKILNGHVACPIGTAVALIRIAERTPNLDYDKAYAARSRYFSAEPNRGVS